MQCCALKLMTLCLIFQWKSFECFVRSAIARRSYFIKTCFLFQARNLHSSNMISNARSLAIFSYLFKHSYDLSPILHFLSRYLTLLDATSFCAPAQLNAITTIQLFFCHFYYVCYHFFVCLHHVMHLTCSFNTRYKIVHSFHH